MAEAREEEREVVGDVAVGRGEEREEVGECAKDGAFLWREGEKRTGAFFFFFFFSGNAFCSEAGIGPSEASIVY